MKFSKILTKQNYFIMIFLLLVILIASFSPSQLSSNKENTIPPAEAATEPVNKDRWSDDASYIDREWEGSGTEEDPYLIGTAEELAGIGGSTRGRHFKQTNDIDLSAHYWTPLSFNSYYDGGGFTITGMFVEDSSSSDYAGLFGFLGGAAGSKVGVYNVNIKDSIVRGDKNVGGIAGKGYGAIEILNCTFDGEVVRESTASGGFVAGIIGYLYGYRAKVTNCTNYAEISGYQNVGGIVGYNVNTTIVESCYNLGKVTASNNRVGGILGNGTGTIRMCVNVGTISGVNYVGGLKGYGTAAMINSYNKANVTGNDYVGGLAGHGNSSGANTKYCYNLGNVTGNAYVGGLIGEASNTSSTYNSVNIGQVRGNGIYLGGIAGYKTTSSVSDTRMSNCYFGGNCTLTYGVGSKTSGSGSNPGTTRIPNITSTSYAKGQTWYTNASNWKTEAWDFTDIWAIKSGYNEGYPYLRSFQYNIVYDLGEGSSGTYAPSSGLIDEAIRISNPTAASGYRFAGWKASGLDTSVAKYGSSSTTVNTSWTNTSTIVTSQYFKNLTSIGSTITLTAQYSGIPYNITYNRNGGSGGTSPPNKVSYGVEFTVTAPTPPSGYTFSGWTGSNLSSTALNNGSRWTGSLTTNGRFSNLRSNGGTATITANYSPVSYTINFNEDGGTSVNNISYNITSISTLPSTTKTGYTFGGWRVTSQSGNWTLNGVYPARYSLNGKYGSPTLTAVWTPIDYKITFVEDGGSTVTDINYTIEDTITLPSSTKTGYNFTNWRVTSAGGNFSSNATFNSGASLTNRYGNVTMIAQWTPKTYNITFNANGGVFSDNSTTKSLTMRYMTGDYYLLGTFIPTREGYDFTGWYTSSGIRVYDENGEAIPGTAYWNSSQQWIYDGTTTFYAHYTESTYTVTLNANGGTVSPSTMQVKYQDTFGQLPIPTRLGYNFTGWYYSNREITETSVYTYKSNITLTANWQSTWYDNAVSPSGEGTQDSPYLITSPENLAWIAREVANGRRTNSYFKQVANIDATSNQWYSIGTSSHPFSGTYDGNGYMISYKQERNANEYGGLFGYTNSANISRVYLIATAFSGESAGALVGYATSTIVDSSFITVSSMTQTGRNLAYIVGYANNATISDCLLEVTSSNSLPLTNGTATTTCIYSVNGEKGYTGADFSNYYYYEGITYPMPSKLFWIAQVGEGMTLQDVQNWVNS